MYNSGNLESLSRRIQLAATSPRDRFGNIAEDASRVSYEDTMKGFRTSSTRVVLPADRCPPAAAALHPEPAPEEEGEIDRGAKGKLMYRSKQAEIEELVRRRRQAAARDSAGGDEVPGVEPAHADAAGEPAPEQWQPTVPRTKSGPLAEVLRKNFCLQTNRVAMAGWLKVVRVSDNSNWASSFKRKKARKARARRISASEAVDSTEHYAILNGLELRWYAWPYQTTRRQLAALMLEKEGAINFHPTIANVVLLPGYVLSARSQGETMERAMSLTFNVHAALM